MMEFFKEIKVGAKQNHRNMMDALETAGAHTKVNGKGMRAAATKRLSEIGRSSVEERRSVSLGNDLRLESERFLGAAWNSRTRQFSSAL